MNFHPFADERAATQIGALTIENQGDRMSLYGSLDITRDKAGLAQAKELLRVLEGTVATLGADSALPDKLAPTEVTMVVNPFSAG